MGLGSPTMKRSHALTTHRAQSKGWHYGSGKPFQILFALLWSCPKGAGGIISRWNSHQSRMKANIHTLTAGWIWHHQHHSVFKESDDLVLNDNISCLCYFPLNNMNTIWKDQFTWFEAAEQEQNCHSAALKTTPANNTGEFWWKICSTNFSPIAKGLPSMDMFQKCMQFTVYSLEPAPKTKHQYCSALKCIVLNTWDWKIM